MLSSGRLRVGLVAGFVTAAALIAFAFTPLAREAFAALGRARGGPALLCFVLVLTTPFLRWLRLQALLPGVAPRALFAASALHGLGLALLPAKTGEAVLPALLARDARTPLPTSVAALLAARLLDLVGVVAMLGLGGTRIIGAFTPDTRGVLLGGAGVALVASVALLVPSVRGFARRLARAFGAFTARQVALAAGASVAVWGALLAATLLALGSVGVPPTLSTGAGALAFGSLAFASPVNGVASLGTYEAAFAGGAALAGVPLAAGVAAATILHACALLAAVLAAGAGLAVRRAQLLRRSGASLA